MVFSKHNWEDLQHQSLLTQAKIYAIQPKHKTDKQSLADATFMLLKDLLVDGYKGFCSADTPADIKIF
jgi:hypothetical protein